MSENKSGNIKSMAGTFAGPAVFFGSFTVYLLTIAPGVTFWDSGELVTAAWSLGISHPPGYPIFAILGKLFSFLPLGNIAYRLNLMSALFGAGTVYLVFLMLEEAMEGVPSSGILAAAGALSFAFYGYFWGVSVIAAVRTLSLFLLTLTAFSLQRFDGTRESRWAHLSAFIIGLSLVGHESVYFIIPAYIIFFLSYPENRRAKAITVSAFLFLLAWSTFLYIPLRGQAKPLINIGQPDSFGNLLWVMKWDRYGDMLRSFISNISKFLSMARIAAGTAALAISAGIIYLLRGRRWLLFMLFAGLSYYFFFTFLTIEDVAVKKMGLLEKYYNPVFIFLIPALSALSSVLWERLPKKNPAIPAIVAALVFAIPISSLAVNFKKLDNSRNFFAYDLAGNELSSVRQDSALFSWGDNAVFPVWYRHGVERYRDDVLFIHSELLTYDWYMKDRAARMYRKYDIAFSPRAPLSKLRENVDGMTGRLKEKTPVYFDFSSAKQLGIPINELVPQGLAWMAPPGKPQRLGKIWDSYSLRGAVDDSTNKDFAVEGILDIYAWEAAVWSQTATSPREAYAAYLISRKLGFRNEQLDRWAESLKSKLESVGK